jgi:hypothetical protein
MTIRLLDQVPLLLPMLMPMLMSMLLPMLLLLLDNELTQMIVTTTTILFPVRQDSSAHIAIKHIRQ